MLRKERIQLKKSVIFSHFFTKGIAGSQALRDITVAEKGGAEQQLGR
jgi:hypothetical protein